MEIFRQDGMDDALHASNGNNVMAKMGSGRCLLVVMASLNKILLALSMHLAVVKSLIKRSCTSTCIPQFISSDQF